MGTGKTLMGMATVHAHAAGRPYRALVFCPGQLVAKWQREIAETIPGAVAQPLEHWSDLPGINRDKPSKPTWYVIARDRAKLGAKWRAASLVRDGMGEAYGRRPRCGKPLTDDGDVFLPLEALSKRQTNCRHCREPLWARTGELRHYEPARYLQKKLHQFFDYLLVDEAHEEKSADSAQGNALGALAAASTKVIALTGTLLGGYAEHIRPLLFRLAPHSLVAEGLTWKNGMAFSERYGRIETRIVEREGNGGEDNRQSRDSKSKTKCVRPGIMPTLFGRHLIGNSVFLGLAEVADNLPPLQETVVPVPLDAELAQHYGQIEQDWTAAIKDMVVRGDRRLLGTMLQTLLAYPDHPYGWETLGYHEGSEGSGEGAFVTVTKPENLAREVVHPKEAKLIELMKREVKQGRQCWVSVQLTGERDVQARLHQLLEREGLQVAELRSSVPLAKREAGIEKYGRKVDVVLSHPRLVETGLDLFSKKKGGHNFSTLIFYETGYNLFTLRQASRRSWRIGQKQECRVFYLYYSETLQERAMGLMGKKLSAAQAIEGKFSSDGLVAMAGEDGGSVELALAKSLADRLHEGDACRAWAKVASTEAKENDPVILPFAKLTGDLRQRLQRLQFADLRQRLRSRMAAVAVGGGRGSRGQA